MASKTDVEVIVGGKKIVLSGYESEEYIQKVAGYVNKKMGEYKKIESFLKQPQDMQSILLQLNIADEYFKVQKKFTKIEHEQAGRDKELYDLKHDIVALQMKIEKLEVENRSLKLKMLNDEAERMQGDYKGNNVKK